MQECYNIPKEKTIHSIYIKPLLKVFYTKGILKIG